MIYSTLKYKHLHKIFFVLVVLLIVNQTLANDFGCQMDMTQHDAANLDVSESKDPHAGHHMSASNELNSMEVTSKAHFEMGDCCDNDCACAQNTCSNSISMIAQVTLTEFNGSKQAVIVAENKLIHSYTSSALHRPPIFC